jgi:hypothetical protein
MHRKTTPVEKKFSRSECSRCRGRAHAKIRANSRAIGAVVSRKADFGGKESSILSALSHRAEFLSPWRKAPWNFCRAVARKRALRVVERSAARRLHRKLSGVTVIFFFL